MIGAEDRDVLASALEDLQHKLAPSVTELEFAHELARVRTLGEGLELLEKQDQPLYFERTKFHGLIFEELEKIVDKSSDLMKDSFEEIRNFWLFSLLPVLERSVIFSGKLNEYGFDSYLVQNSINEAIVGMLTDKIFTLILSFPESLKCVLNLSTALKYFETRKYIDFKQNLKSTLLSQLSPKLLNLGLDTLQIIHGYINLIRVLRILDPKHTLITELTPCISEYLSTRKNTTQCIISLLTDDTEEKEKSNKNNRKNHIAEFIALETEESQNNINKFLHFENINLDAAPPTVFNKWEPEPLDPSGEFYNFSTSATRDDVSKLAPKRFDILSMLIHIYVNEEAFMNQYRLILSGKLLRKNAQKIYAKESVSLELLKARFGASNVRRCEIMLRDVEKSAKTWKDIMDVVDDPIKHSFDALIISKEFWPDVSDEVEGLILPMKIQRLYEKYAEQFRGHRKPQKVEWFNSKGVVSLELELDDGNKLSVTCTPTCATLILYLSKYEALVIKALAKGCGMDVVSCKTHMLFWIQKGLVLLSQDTYTLCKTIGEFQPLELAQDPSKDAAQGIAHDDIEFYRGYVLGMMNYERTMSIHKIHNKLKVFVTERNYDKSIPQLRVTLDVFCGEGLLENEGDEYTLT